MSTDQETVRDRLAITMVVAGLVSDAIEDARHADREWPVCMQHAERIVAVLRAADRADRASEASPISDTEVARIIEAVEAHCGMGRGAWDMVAARDLVEGFAAALGADTRRIDAPLRAAIDSVLLPTAPGAPEEGAGE